MEIDSGNTVKLTQLTVICLLEISHRNKTHVDSLRDIVKLTQPTVMVLIAITPTDIASGNTVNRTTHGDRPLRPTYLNKTQEIQLSIHFIMDNCA
jgi:hypothetical protein